MHVVGRIRKYQRPGLRDGELTRVGLSVVAAPGRAHAHDAAVPIATVRDLSVYRANDAALQEGGECARASEAALTMIAVLDVGRGHISGPNEPSGIASAQPSPQESAIETVWGRRLGGGH